MKIGADSMLLGALVSPGNAENILDIGTGSGVLALMMAQKSKAEICALEIETNAYMQALENASASSWKNRICILHTSLQNFRPENNLHFYLIISNPPYFPQTKSAKSRAATQERIVARDHSSLSFAQLLQNAAELLADTGKLYVIIPFSEMQHFIELAKKNNLFLAENIRIRSKKESSFIRVILGFSFDKNIIRQTKDFTIYEEKNIYTEEYLAATEDFHAQDLRKKQVSKR